MPPRNPPSPAPPKRAVSPDQKQQRRQAILDAALSALVVTPFDAITMQSLATHLGLVKGTLYLYFATKEELFLTLQEQQLEAWFADLHAVLAEAARPLAPAALAQLLVASLERRPQLAQLLSVLHGVLERNISVDRAISFKHFLRSAVASAGAAVEAALPALCPGQGTELLLRLHALIIGTWQVTDISAAVRAAIAQHAEDFRVFDLQFVPFLRGALVALISGMARGA